MKQIIMISGKAGHGKDTVAQLLKEELEQKGEKVLTIHFGDPVKWFAREYYGYTGKKDQKERALLQYIGTEMMRRYDKYYWGSIISEFIAANEDFTIAIIPDWRFYSELRAIEQDNPRSVITIRVNRTNYENESLTPEQRHHISETELDDAIFDYTIENNGTLEDLREKIRGIV